MYLYQASIVPGYRGWSVVEIGSGADVVCGHNMTHAEADTMAEKWNMLYQQFRTGTGDFANGLRATGVDDAHCGRDQPATSGERG